MPARLVTLLATALLLCAPAPVVAGGLLGHVIDKVLDGHENSHPGHEPRRVENAASEEPCDNDLGFLARYTVADVEAVSQDNQVSIAFVCEETDEVNVAGLLGAIDANAYLKQVLQSQNATVNDVVGIRIDAEYNAILYVNADGSLVSAAE
jgi:hypothetical protein